MNDQQLGSFLAAAELGSFSRAAKRERLAVQALVQRINTLEGELGFELFTRTAKGSLLTPEGDIFAKAARQALDVLESGATHARALSTEGSVLIRIGHPWRLFPALQRLCVSYCNEHPQVAIEYAATLDGNPFEDLVNQRYDITLLPFGLRPLPHGIKSRQVCMGNCLCAFQPECDLNSLDFITPADLAGRNVIFGFDYRSMDTFRYLNDWPSTTTISTSTMPGEKMLLKCLEDPNTVALFSEDTAPLACPPLTSRPLEPATPYPTGVYYRSDLSPELSNFLEYLVHNYRSFTEAYI